jgi:hypothetical protein
MTDILSLSNLKFVRYLLVSNNILSNYDQITFYYEIIDKYRYVYKYKSMLNSLKN